MTITRSALVERLASAADISEKDAAAVLSTVLDAVGQALCRGDRVELRNLGAFSARQHQGRKARDPRTGEPISVPAKRSVHFKGGRQLLRALNGDEQALAVLRKKREEQRRQREKKRTTEPILIAQISKHAGKGFEEGGWPVQFATSRLANFAA